MKRPAATMKRPAAVQSVSNDAPAEPPRKRAATASVSIEAVAVIGAAGIEAACGERYRREVSDLGLGLGEREMREKLESWGYAVTREACRKWLQQFRLVTMAKDGNSALFAASKADLQYWYHVEKLSPTALQQRYLQEHGVFAHRTHLYSWLKAPAQKLPQLDTNECIQGLACGEYVLDERQRGAMASSTGCCGSISSRQRFSAWRRIGSIASRAARTGRSRA